MMSNERKDFPMRKFERVHGDTTDAEFFKGEGIALTQNGVEFIVIAKDRKALSKAVGNIMHVGFEIKDEKLKQVAMCRVEEITEF